jgi:hypothetical protein
MASNNRTRGNRQPPRSQPLQDDSDKSDEEEEPNTATMLTSDARRENIELKKRIEELQRHVAMVSAASGSSISSVTTTGEETETGSVAAMQLPEGKRQLVRTFVREVAWKMVKFVPDEDKVFEISKELLPQLLKYCHINTLKDKLLYEKTAKKAFTEFTNEKRSNVKTALMNKYKSKIFGCNGMSSNKTDTNTTASYSCTQICGWTLKSSTSTERLIGT